jgi:hypothetical protein
MSLITFLVLVTLAVLLVPALAWNIPGHMLSAAIVYQVVRQENLIGLTSLTPKHSVIASSLGGVVCSEVLVCQS